MLWVQSWRREAHLTGLTSAGRWTLRSVDGRLALFVAPRPTPGAIETEARKWVASVLSEELDCHVNCEIGGGFFHPTPDRPVGVGWWGDAFGTRTPDGSAAALLAALESPQTFLRAHIALARIYRTDTRVAFEGSPALRDDGLTLRLPATIDGLRVVLRDPHGRIIPHGMFAYYAVAVDTDAAQLPFIRDQWHRRLDVPAGSIRYGYLLMLTLVLPAMLTFMGIARRIRRRACRLQNRCPSCGYDLRASKDRCPECGSPTPAEARA